MPEEVVKAAQTSENTQDGAADAAHENEDDVTDVSFTDSEEPGTPGAEDKGEKPEAPKNPPQTKEQNSEFARKRREAERQKELKEIRDNTIIETLGGKNPYTGGEMKDSADVEEYLTMREIEKNGGDPVADFAEHHKKTARQAAKEAENAAREAEWYRRDGEDFAKKHPDVDLMELAKDSAFADYADGKIGRKPLAEIYEGYLKITGENGSGESEQKAREIAAQMVANRKSAVGSLGGAGGGDVDFISREDVAKMSVQECERNYDKIIKSMPHWK